MFSSPEAIRSALQQYRTTISAHNRQALEIYVLLVMSEIPDEDDDSTDAEINGFRIGFFDGLLEGENVLRQLTINTPEQVLPRYDELVPKLGLDGTEVSEDAHSRNQHRDTYFDTIKHGLRTESREDVRETIALPEEFVTLAGLVDALRGPGLPEYQAEAQAFFWEGIFEDVEAVKQRVKTPDELRPETGLDTDDYTIGGGWNSGGGQYADFCVVYCKKSEEDSWGWRYTTSSEGDARVFDTIPELLEWYSTYREQDLEQIKSDGVDIFDGSANLREPHEDYGDDED